MEEQFNKILKKYLSTAEKFFGKLPEHCYDVEIVLGANPTNNSSSGADCVYNIIYIHPDMISKNKDLEWTIFHEMEHIRLARKPGNDYCTGFYVRYEYGTGEALNEGITEIAVGNMLKRKSFNLYGYYETTQLVRQILALLGKDDNDVMGYCQISGKEKFIKDFKELTGKDVFAILDSGLQNVHDWHGMDLEKEFIEFGEIKVKPLGKYCSNETIKARETFHDIILSSVIKFASQKGSISKEELQERVDKMEKLTPYKSRELNKKSEKNF